MYEEDENPHGEPLQILLVEDDPAHTELIMRCFEEHRIANQIQHLRDGEAALDYLFHRGAFADPPAPRPHLVLLDLRLPRVDGLEVLKAIKTDSELESLPVIILTTSAAEKDVARAYAHHANSYLVKPVDFEEFAQLISDLGFYWLGWNHYPWDDK